MATFDPSNVDLNTASKEEVISYLSLSENEYNGHLGARISSVFVIFITYTAFTLFPVVAQRLPRWRIPHHVYLFGRYFGTEVIMATAFIHLLDPAYQSIGPQTCISMSSYWGEYSWCAAIVLTSVMVIFPMDVGAEVYIKGKYNVQREENATAAFITQPALSSPHESLDRLTGTELSSQPGARMSTLKQTKSL